jgi:hypothetical protein
MHRSLLLGAMQAVCHTAYRRYLLWICVPRSVDAAVMLRFLPSRRRLSLAQSAQTVRASRPFDFGEVLP